MVALAFQTLSNPQPPTLLTTSLLGRVLVQCLNQEAVATTALAG